MLIVAMRGGNRAARTQCGVGVDRYELSVPKGRLDRDAAERARTAS